ncbi:MAG: hypothetical protein MZV70_06685 [Desulfobacterales bacterium]|nr:hypothetical protein [Desulfobacterales bacterium]
MICGQEAIACSTPRAPRGPNPTSARPAPLGIGSRMIVLRPLANSWLNGSARLDREGGHPLPPFSQPTSAGRNVSRTTA